MTRQRFDTHSTEFGLWLRKQPEIDSELGYVTSNIDYFWLNHKTGKFMLLEEKRFMAILTFTQSKIFQILHNTFKSNLDYCGFHLIQFEKTGPEDGKIFWDNKEINKETLKRFLSFKQEQVP